MRNPLWLLLFGASACFGGGENELRARAAYDFNCPQDSLVLTELQERNWGATTNHGAVYGVSGCGHRATYVNNVGAWILNNSEDQPRSPGLTLDAAPLSL